MYTDTNQSLTDSIQSKNTNASIDNLSAALMDFSRSLSSVYSSDRFIGSAALLSALSKSMASIAESAGIPQSSFDFLKGINFQNEYIELTEESCDSINALSKLSSAKNPVLVTPDNKTSTIQFIITILIPIIIGLLQIGQNAYYHYQDSAKPQTVQTQDQEFQEQLLEILMDIRNSLKQSNPPDESVHQSELSTHTSDEQPQDALAE